ncbi:hypothetical protein WH47_06832 [Habropoda laboriosa]|uniref:Uncharacterized protein n=1 Tax=Habropoda laboriosa TaxID=597456 RepID=A0A0L7RIK1_9HYME|nr:hypothetical protein WH47_06832 [Habropoda laboriosa]
MGPNESETGDRKPCLTVFGKKHEGNPTPNILVVVGIESSGFGLVARHSRQTLPTLPALSTVPSIAPPFFHRDDPPR